MLYVDHREESTYSDAELATRKPSISSLYWAVKQLKQNKQKKTPSTTGPMAKKSSPSYIYSVFLFVLFFKSS